MDAVTLRHVDKAYTSYSTEIVITGEQRQSRTRQVLKDLSVTFAAGQLTVIVGPQRLRQEHPSEAAGREGTAGRRRDQHPAGLAQRHAEPRPYVITWTNVQRNVAMACGVGKTPQERYERPRTSSVWSGWRTMPTSRPWSFRPA